MVFLLEEGGDVPLLREIVRRAVPGGIVDHDVLVITRLAGAPAQRVQADLDVLPAVVGDDDDGIARLLRTGS